MLTSLYLRLNTGAFRLRGKFDNLIKRTLVLYLVFNYYNFDKKTERPLEK